MVLRGERDYMATTTTRPERSTALHNFTLPNLKWGSQRHLKCMRIDSVSSGGSSDHRIRRRSPSFKFSGYSVSTPFRFGRTEKQSRNNNNQHHQSRNGREEGIEEFRVKILSDLKTVRDNFTQSILKKEAMAEHDEERTTGYDQEKEKEKEREISPAKPWNLRKRKAAGKEPISGNQYNSFNKGFPIEEKIANPSPSRNDWTMSKGKGGVAEAESKLFVQLSKKETNEDFIAMFGHRPPRRPKKRSRNIQKKLDNLFPGLALFEVTLDAYKVPKDAKNLQR